MSLTEPEKIFQKIHDGWLETQQGSLFGVPDSPFDNLTEACIEYLRFKGYKVIEPPKYKYSNINKLDDLIHIFYVFSDNKHPELMNSYRNLAKDRRIASAMVNARRLATGCNKKIAMVECAEIIETIFEHEDAFSFNMPISFGILGQKNCGWITDKAIQIINKKRKKSEEERRTKFISDLDEKYELEPGGFGDLDEILDNLEE